MERRTRFSWWGAGVVVLLLIALLLRLRGLTTKSITVDEFGMLEGAIGVLKWGFPYFKIGHIYMRLTTYELVPYPIALFWGLFGLHTWAARLPAVLMGVATTGLIYWAGSKVFDRATGFFAALIYAFAPLSIQWARYAFHPSQDQLLGFVSVYLFYRGAIESSELKSGYLYGSLATFAAAYLSWEGLGLLLPIFLLSLFLFRSQDWSWMKSGPLWILALGATVVVFVEMCGRFTAAPWYILLGDEMRWSKTPTAAFLHTYNDWWFPWRNFFWAQGRAILTCLAFFGIPLIKRDRALAYFYLIVVGFALELVFFEETLITHYVYCLFPFLILIACRTVTIYLSRVGELLSTGAVVDRIIKYALAACALILIFITSNNSALSLYRLAPPAGDEPYQDRMHYEWVDFRAADGYLFENAATDPLVTATGVYLELFHNYNDLTWVMTSPMKQELYDTQATPPTLLVRLSNAKVLTTIPQLQDFLSTPRPVYIGTRAVWETADVRQFLENWSNPIFHTYGCDIYQAGR